MIQLERLQIIAQLADNMEISAAGLEKTYSEKDIERFNKYKQDISNAQKRISQIIKNL